MELRPAGIATNIVGFIRTILRSRLTRNAFITAAATSALINILYLTSSFYMLQVYDRVLPSRSIPSLIALSVLVGILYLGQWLLEFLRTRIFIRIALLADSVFSLEVFRRLKFTASLPQGTAHAEQVVRDLDQMRGFVSGGALSAFFDLPWIPIYLFVCYLFHPLVCLAASAGAAVLIVFTLATDLLTRGAVARMSKQSVARSDMVAAVQRNSETLRALGMYGRFVSTLERLHQDCLLSSKRVGDTGSFFSTVSKTFRITLQSAVLGLGAYLVIQNQATAGIIIASSILSSRALSPIEQVIAQWKTYVSARQSWKRIAALLKAPAELSRSVDLPPPSQNLMVESLRLVLPQDGRTVLQNVSFALRAGSAVGVIGPSASGKSSLARALVGAWRPTHGCIRLDGAAIDQWSEESLGAHIGYMPQNIELFDGTISANIARFDPHASTADVIQAARRAGIHDMIVHLPAGYDTLLGVSFVPSAGQRQRLALARALYKEPFLLVLDEPNSNLDADGDVALLKAIEDARSRGCIVVLVAHRPNALSAVDHVLLLADGATKAFGPRDQILRSAVRTVNSAPAVPQRAGAA